MGVEDRAVVTCALSGIAANRQQCPALPYTPEEFAEEARRAWEAGAAVVHVRARHPDTGAPAHDVDRYRDIVEAIGDRTPGLLVSFSTIAIGVARDQRLAPARELRPDLAGVQLGSVTYAIWSTQQRRFLLDVAQSVTFGETAVLLDELSKAGVTPDHVCFDAGHVANLRILQDSGHAGARPHVSLVLGVHGGAPASVHTLSHLVRELPSGAAWQVVGVRHPEQWRLVAGALALGGSVRVGLEDNYYVEDKTMATSNGQLVDKAVRMARDAGRDVASADEARALLGLAAETTGGRSRS